MKKTFILLAFLAFGISLLPLTAHSQNQTEFWGMTESGGNCGGSGSTCGGVIFYTDGNGNNQHVIEAFIENIGAYPYHDCLCEASNGKLYGMTAGGGTSNYGVLFEYDPFTSTYAIRVDFNGNSNGMFPHGGLIQASNGKLYGTTVQGGIHAGGVLFEYDPMTSSYTKKIDFDGSSNGSSPTGSLIQASNGLLYGMTSNGGAHGDGVIFEYDPASSTLAIRYAFDDNNNGRHPQGSLVQAINGKLYGMTNDGGVNNMGVLFEYDIATSTYTKNLDFAGNANGSDPRGTLMQATNGKLYGVTRIGGTNNCGVLFEYDPTSSTYIKKLDFDYSTTGSAPEGSLMQASNGKLYGYTKIGGAHGEGVLFEYDPYTNAYTKKLDFDGGSCGSYPTGSLMQASNGNLFGTTSDGGSANCGVLFEFNPTTSTYVKKFDFQSSNKGSIPKGSLMQASDGMLYGMTSFGGSALKGVLFELDPASNTYTKKIDFPFPYTTPNIGYTPYGSLMQASNGKLYGMTGGGGTNGYGVLFEYDPSTSTYAKKVDFNGSSNGKYPRGGLIQATNGKLYGLTPYGGAADRGVLFEYDPITFICEKKVDFTGINGVSPSGDLIQASNGWLYGTTNIGGDNNLGVLFKFNPVTTTFIKIYDFSGTSDGSRPCGSLIQYSNGKLYGLTNLGGVNNYGVLFEYDPATSTFTKKFDFDGTNNGSHPYGSLMQASNGRLYGMTYDGGASDYGVIFEYDPISSVYIKKLDFNELNGKNPYYTNLIEICAQPKFLSAISDVSTCPDENIDFITSASGNDLTFEWQVDEGSGFYTLSNNAVYEDVTDDTLHLISVLSAMNNFKYRCIVTSTCPVRSIVSDTAILFVNPVYASTETYDICNGQSYNWHGQVLSAAGIYYDNILSEFGCDSLFTLTLTVNPAYAYTESYAICDGQTYLWHGQNLTLTGTYHDDHQTITGYDSTYTLNLSVNPVYSFIENHEICSGQTYIWHGQSLTGTGTYIDDHHLTTSGCDSSFTLNLTINSNPAYVYSEFHSICYGQTYVWHGQSLTSAGTFHDNYTSISGCDSTYTLYLAVNPVYTSIENQEICNGQTYIWHGQSLTSAGTFFDNHTSISGCDSTFTLYLVVNPVYSFTENQEICNGQTYIWHGQSLTGTGTYIDDHHLTTSGCDSTFTLNLTANPSYSFTLNQDICNGDTFTWQGNDYTAPGNYVANYLSIHGCDSIYELDLDVHTVDISLTITDPTITADSLADAYQWLDCDNVFIPIPGATLQSYTATSNGNYAVIINQGLCSDTSVCIPITAVSVASEYLSGVALYPNPSNGQFTLELDENAKVEIFNALGSELYTASLKKGKHLLSLNLADGVYLLKVTNNNMSRSLRMVIQK